MDVSKSLENMSKDMGLLIQDLASMMAEDKPQDASRKSLEPSSRLEPLGTPEKGPPPTDPDEQRSEYITEYISNRFGDIF